MNTRRQSWIMYAIGVAAPLLTVALVRFSGPETSMASILAPADPAASLPSLETTRAGSDTDHASARERARHLDAAGPSPSPFLDAGVTDDPLPDDPGSDTPGDEPGGAWQPAARQIETPQIRVTAIMSRRGGAIAVVDHRLRREGDLIAPEWVLYVIDPGDRRLVLRHVTGVRREIVLVTP